VDWKQMRVKDAIAFLSELNQEDEISHVILEDKSITVYVDSKGNATALRNRHDRRLMMIDLPV
jgi:hypothetical protein